MSKKQSWKVCSWNKGKVGVFIFVLLIDVAMTILSIQLWGPSLNTYFWLILASLITLISTWILSKYEVKTHLGLENITNPQSIELGRSLQIKATTATLWVSISVLIIGGIALMFYKVTDYIYFLMGFDMMLIGVVELWLFFVFVMLYYHKDVMFKKK